MPSIIFAKESNKTYSYMTLEELEKLNENELKDYLAYTLELYFSKIGHINKDGIYIIDNPELLLKQAEEGDEVAMQLYNIHNHGDTNYNTYVLYSYTGHDAFWKCVLKDQFAWLLDFMNGDMLHGLGHALQTGAWQAASEIMTQAVKMASKTAGKAVGWVYTAASVAMSAYICRNEW
ncbi:hypothetical protein SAMN00017477_0073 [Peptoniphilus asaccharolyticus DSM 20463]|uniref:Uncharacterized protein n=1 Tax=Peptoniphilus asaccharolyticus DSM 20463 TaxID=573058 RepID=A0A1W1UBX9_PEPAS|nr:hypothetical protein [Peptoniphilus asaccharolyticus]MBL7576426.1 hypothetical protein [Peptoniphilus asaccharolyticus]SMB78608.1 hypothetical protein SAMN00017477_0073 [Peptoniphilus asaccharolyticus DSM 20463]